MSLMDYTDQLNHDAAVEILRDAEQLIEKGWCQNNYASPDYKEFCTSGAIRYASRGKSFYVRRRAMQMFRETLARVTSGRYRNIPEWNDVPSRTKAQVLTMFGICIKENEYASD